MTLNKPVSKSFVIFCAIGALNTLIDVSLFYVLYGAGLAILLANIISTSAALSASLFLNNKFTFSGSKITRQTVVSFLVVTLTGLWLLQPAIIWLVLSGIGQAPFVHAATADFVSDPAKFDPLIAKFIALPATITWNYLWYKSVVFNNVTGRKAR